MVTPWIPQGVMAEKPERSGPTLSPNPCMVIQRRTPTPMLAILRSLIHTPVRPSRRRAARLYSASKARRPSSIQRRKKCRSGVSCCRSKMK